jgi:hypothetical protein|nr:hypothetical protein [uncultured Albidiferax sp.]
MAPSPTGGGLGWGPDALTQILSMGEQQIAQGRTLSATQAVARIRQRILQS